MALAKNFFKRVAYTVPEWASELLPPAHGRVLLANLPTPLMPWACPALKDLNVRWYIKRDDLSGAELSGNKARKLEFLMAEAFANGHDCVVTIGGLQSNHCRATAAAARLVGIEPHLVLLVSDRLGEQDPGMQGNLLLDRMLGATLHLCPASHYFRYGGDLDAINKLNLAAAADLRKQGRNPYVIPVGGSTALAAWGYIHAVQELQEQLQREEEVDDSRSSIDHIVVATGTGSTAAGLAIGCRLAKLPVDLHAVNIQHSPDTFFREIAAEASALGCRADRDGDVHEWLSIHDGTGAGYGSTTDEQLDFIRDVGFASGVVLDHVYAGKALHYFCMHARDNPEKFQGKNILFWHTGGLYGLYAQEQKLLSLMPQGKVLQMQPP